MIGSHIPFVINSIWLKQYLALWVYRIHIGKHRYLGISALYPHNSNLCNKYTIRLFPGICLIENRYWWISRYVEISFKKSQLEITPYQYGTFFVYSFWELGASSWVSRIDIVQIKDFVFWDCHIPSNIPLFGYGDKH